MHSFAFGEETPTIDLCQLLDRRWLRQYGDAVIQRGLALADCHASMKRGDAVADFTVRMYPPSAADTISTKGNTSRTDIGSMTIYQDVDEPDIRCQNVIRLDDGSYAEIWTSESTRGLDRCEVVHTGTRLVARGLARGSPPRDPELPSKYRLAGKDSCDALDDKALSKIPSLAETDISWNWSKWSCTWGNDSEDATGASYVTIDFYRAVEPPAEYAEHESTIDGKKYYYEPDGNFCYGYLVYDTQPDRSRPQMLYMDMYEPQASRTCGDLRDLMTVANQRLS